MLPRVSITWNQLRFFSVLWACLIVVSTASSMDLVEVPESSMSSQTVFFMSKAPVSLAVGPTGGCG
jgi:hypothetical protein